MMKNYLNKTRHIVYINTFWAVILMTLLALSGLLTSQIVVPAFMIVGLVMLLCNALAWISFFLGEEKKERITLLLLAFNTLGSLYFLSVVVISVMLADALKDF